MLRRQRRRAPGGSILALAMALFMAAIAAPSAVGASVYESYSLEGYEVWFTSTVGSFAGTGRGSGGELAAWHGAIEHSLVISPTGTITGGWATLYLLDGTRISGWFSGGTLQQLDDGPGCTNEVHAVRGSLTGVSRSDAPAFGTGLFEATLTHHRLWIFGRCISYSASVSASLRLSF